MVDFREYMRRNGAGYVVAVLTTAIAVLLRLALFGIVGKQAPFFPFGLSVLVTAWYGGVIPGLFATALGGLLGIYFFGDASGSAGDITTVPFFLAIGVVSSFLCGALHEAKRRSEEQQREADRRKDEFLATLAHELRNPLAPLRNAVELMRTSFDKRNVMEKCLGIMERQLGQMVHLVDDLLDISRITTGKIYLRKERVLLGDVIQGAVEAIRPLIESQAHQLRITLPPEPVYLEADPRRLAQIFANLLNNAAKYTEKNGQIWLTAERRGREVVVSVRDSGIGIAEHQLPQLFEKFSQVSSSLAQSQSGLGLGLALVKGLVESHGGKVEVRSAGLGTGSEFIVRLPLAELPVRSAKESKIELAADYSGPKRRILVADDLPDSVDSLAMMLREAGHDVQTAFDGFEAIQAAASFRPNVAILDIGMPKLNGYEVAVYLRNQPWGEDMVLIALTGWGQEDDKRRAKDAGFDHHLTKPVEVAVLRKLLVPTNSKPNGEETPRVGGAGVPS